MTLSLPELQIKAKQIRIDILSMLANSGTGHAAGALGMTDIFVSLYYFLIKLDPTNPEDENRDYIVLSNGHICPVQYAILADLGYFDRSELSTLREIGSRLQGHPNRNDLPGIEVSSGPLGQGTSQSVGLALGLRMDSKKNKVICLLSDGECNEGQVWEAAMLAAKYKLNNLIWIVDRNNIQIDGRSDDVMPLGSLEDKFTSFGWQSNSLDGHNYTEITESLSNAYSSNTGPIVFVANTVPGKGVSFMENDYKWHGKAPSASELIKAIKEIENG